MYFVFLCNTQVLQSHLVSLVVVNLFSCADVSMERCVVLLVSADTKILREKEYCEFCYSEISMGGMSWSNETQGKDWMPFILASC